MTVCNDYQPTLTGKPGTCNTCGHIQGVHQRSTGSIPGVSAEEVERVRRIEKAAPVLLAALKELMPEGWGDDDTMDHMPGIKLARLAIRKAEGR